MNGDMLLLHENEGFSLLSSQTLLDLIHAMFTELFHYSIPTFENSEDQDELASDDRNLTHCFYTHNESIFN